MRTSQAVDAQIGVFSGVFRPFLFGTARGFGLTCSSSTMRADDIIMPLTSRVKETAGGRNGGECGKEHVTEPCRYAPPKKKGHTWTKKHKVHKYEVQ